MKIKKSNQTLRLQEAIDALKHIAASDPWATNAAANVYVASNALATIQALEEQQNGDHP